MQDTATQHLMRNLPFHKNSLLFAPLEGITDEPYRKSVMKLFPQWDRYSTDFLRIPTEGRFKETHIIEHFGNDIFKNEELKSKTTFQVLTTVRANTEHTVKQIQGLGFNHLDLNLGCPSKKVNSRGGGAFLMSDPESLKNVLGKIRKNFSEIFTVKIRVGYRDDSLFEECLKIIQEEGVDAVTVHARTRDQLYKGVADWSYLKKAQELCQIPVIANGDVWTTKDINQVFKYTQCHSVMFGRPAMKTPWLPLLYKNNILNNHEQIKLRTDFLGQFFYELKSNYSKINIDEISLLRRFKAVSRYLFDDYQDNEVIKRRFMRSKSLDQFFELLKNLRSND